MKTKNYFFCYSIVAIMLILSLGATPQLPTNQTKGIQARAQVTDATSHYVPTNNDVKSFVYRWFAWLDHQVEDFLFLYHLAKNDLQMEVPGATIRTHQDFIAWYAVQRAEILSNEYDVGEIKIKQLPRERFRVEIVARHKGTGVAGKNFDYKYRYSWELNVSEAGRLTIYRYRVKKIK
ncbi:MAG: hypothetical protein ABH865_01490 [Candidatus Omnitrophota bacterium]